MIYNWKYHNNNNQSIITLLTLKSLLQKTMNPRKEDTHSHNLSSKTEHGRLRNKWASEIILVIIRGRRAFEPRQGSSMRFEADLDTTRSLVTLIPTSPAEAWWDFED